MQPETDGPDPGLVKDKSAAEDGCSTPGIQDKSWLPRFPLPLPQEDDAITQPWSGPWRWHFPRGTVGRTTASQTPGSSCSELMEIAGADTPLLPQFPESRGHSWD